MIQTVNNFKILSLVVATTVFACCASAAGAQEPGLVSQRHPWYEQLRGRNAAQAKVQPSWMGPLIQSDSRLSQGARASFSHEYAASGSETMNYGNNHTVNFLLSDRVQVNLVAPAYQQNHNPAMKDGFGDTSYEVKYRIASGNAAHGNYALTAMTTYSIPTGSYQNGAAGAALDPTVAVGKMWGRFDIQTTIGGTLPTGKIAAQGRQIGWNTTGQVAIGNHLWVDLEDNATYNFGGPSDGLTENFLTPAAFCVIKRQTWKPTHPLVAFGGGMQIATSRFHTYNHNLIPEMRFLF
jgi:hypothetical protein